jgi:hypothetical protein
MPKRIAAFTILALSFTFATPLHASDHPSLGVRHFIFRELLREPSRCSRISAARRGIFHSHPRRVNLYIPRQCSEHAANTSVWVSRPFGCQAFHFS